MDHSKLERMLRIIILLTSNRQYSIEDIAKRIFVTPRTVYRYIDTIKEVGFLVKKHNEKYYYIDRNSNYFKDISDLVHFSAEESLLLRHAIDNIDENTQIKQNLKKKLYTIYDYRILPEIVIHKGMAGNVSELMNAINEKKQVRLLEYRSSHSSQVTDRLVEPFEFTTNFVQVWCYEPATGINKLFRLSRIQCVEKKESSWQYEPQHSASNIDLFRISTTQRMPIHLRLGIKSANLLREEFPLSEKELQQEDTDHWILKTEVCSYDGVGRFVMGLLDDIEIIDSPSLVHYLKEKIEFCSKNLNKVS